MPSNPRSPARRQRPSLLLVATLASFSALAAVGYTSSLGTASGPRAQVTPVAAAAKAASAAGLGRQAAATVATPLPLTGTVANATATPGWVSLNKGLALQPGLSLSAAPSAQPLHLAVVVGLRDTQGLQAFIKASHTPGNKLYGTVLTTAQFNDAYAPTTAQTQAVTDYLASHGFRNVHASGNRALVSADGTAGLAEAAFNTHLVNFAWGGHGRYANTTDVQVPTALQGIALSVAGMTNLPTMHLRYTVAPASARNAGVVTPQTGTAATHSSGYTGPQFATAYDADSLAPAYNTTMAIITGGDDLSDVIAQLRLEERVQHLPVVPVTVKQVVPLPTSIDTSGDDEWELDSQSSTAMANNAKQLIFYNGAGLDDTSLMTAATDFASDNVAQVGNMSFGGCENLNVQMGTLVGYEQAYMQAAAQGQTWFASTGDEGSACSLVTNTGTPAGVPDVEYPAASPNVVAVGGTTLSTDAKFGYVTETAWLGGGGGISNIFAPPQWQVDSGAATGATVGGTVGGLPIPTTTVLGGATGAPASEAGIGRSLPDIAMSGDPASGLMTYVAGSTETVGGTSLSSPLAMGAYARIQTAHCNTLGFGAPRFYALDTTKGMNSTAMGFHDVTSGTNGIYMASTGYDNTTGFGSFDVAAVDKALPAAANCVLNHVPVARLSADTTTGNVPTSVTFSGSGSTDPDADAIVQYTLDYGDNSALVVQATPVFPAHSYALPGTYTATLLVRDAVGNSSQPAALPITVFGVPQGCVAPGAKLITSPAGVSPGVVSEMPGTDGFMGQDDLQSTAIAEPPTQAGELVFTIKVDNLSPQPLPALRWVTYFNIPEDTSNYYVSMDTSTGTPTYTYGIRTNAVSVPAVGAPAMYQMLGTLNAASTENADGTITLVLDKSALKLKTGDTLTNIATSVRLATPNDPTGTVALGIGLTQDSGTATQGYTLVGNDVCAADVANPPTAPTGGTPTPTSGGGTPTPTTGTGGTPTPTSGGGTPTPTSGGGTPTPTTGTGGTTPVPTTTQGALGPTVVSDAGSGSAYGRGGAGAFGWLVLGPLAAGALRRRRRTGTRTGAR